MWRYAERPNYRQTELYESNTSRVITIPKPESQKEQKKAKKENQGDRMLRMRKRVSIHGRRAILLRKTRFIAAQAML